jgi:hypothetical protein
MHVMSTCSTTCTQASPTARTRAASARDEPRITPVTLAGAPELAVLALLDETLRITAEALLAAQPALIGAPPSWRATTELLAAERLLRDARRLGGAVAHYRRSVLQTLLDAPDNDHLPF